MKRVKIPPSGDYEVGKGRPPQRTRWKPGQSGNPKGRPKGARSLATIFHQALNQKIEIREKGKTRKITAIEGMAKQLVHQALKGDIKAVAFLLAKEPEISQAAERLNVTKIEHVKLTPEEALEFYNCLRTPPVR
jgi:Family of unknown function (DUF5681)